MIIQAGRSAGRRAPWLLVIAVVVALPGCSGDTSADRPEDTPTPRQSRPLSDLLGLGGAPDSAQALVAERTWQENLTAQCMSDLGFAYLPAIPDADSVVFTDGPVGGTTVDPNWDRVQAMSEAERAAYELALYGEQEQLDAEPGPSAAVACLEASRTPVDDDTYYFVSVREDAMQYLMDLHNDPAFSDANAEWATCMADAGFVEGSPLLAQKGVHDQCVAATVEGEKTSVDPARVEEEIRLASADLDCQEATGWPVSYGAIAHRLEQEYSDDHQAELDALIEAVPTSGS